MRMIRPNSFGDRSTSARHVKPAAAVFLGYEQPEPHTRAD
jgi:hypothetical protein